ncbi:hypothetical protein Tco_0300630 [Tanacetum coccineum]
MASQDTRLSKFEADFKRQQGEMTNKIDTVLKAIIDQITSTLPSDTVKNPKLSTSPVLFVRSYPTQDPQCSNHVHGSINSIIIHPSNQTKLEMMNQKKKNMEKREALKTPTPWYIMMSKGIHRNWSQKDDYDRGYRMPSDLEDRFYRDTIKLGPEYLTGMEDEGEVTYLAFGRHLEEIHVTWAHLRRNGKEYEPTPTSLKNFYSEAGDGVADYT